MLREREGKGNNRSGRRITCPHHISKRNGRRIGSTHE